MSTSNTLLPFEPSDPGKIATNGACNKYGAIARAAQI
jgi:hypothetical protein